MAIWYKTYAALKDHPKVLMFSNLIGAVNEIEGLGYLHLFFSAVCAYAEDGGLEKLPVPVVEKMCKWGGKPGLFIESLEKSGFIDNTPEGKIVHEWWEINGHQVKEHARKEKARKPRTLSADNPQPVRVTDRQTDQQTNIDSSKRDSIDAAVVWFLALRASQELYKGMPYDPGQKGHGAAVNLFCGPKPPIQKELDHAAENFFASDGNFTFHHSAASFFNNFHSWLVGPLNRAGGGQRKVHAGNGSGSGEGGSIYPGRKGAASGGAGGRFGKGNGPKGRRGEGSLAGADPLGGKS